MLSNVKSSLRSLSKYDLGLYMRFLYRIVRQKNRYKKFPDDRQYVEKLYLERTGRTLCLDDPKRFTEKLQWLKLYNHNPLASQCADKVEVRKYIEEKGYADLLNEVIAVYDDVKQIDVDKLPSRFVLKATHGSSMNFICKDKDSVNWRGQKRICDLWLKLNLYLDGREWVYKSLKPRIVAEKYLEDDSGALRDYKFFCFGGEPRFIQVDEDRYSDHHQAYYSTDWKKEEFNTGCKTCDVDKPEHLDEMLKIARDLSSEFPFVRVDLYNCNGKIYFGELTFFGGSGFYSFYPDEYDFKFGEMIKLDK